jgi:phage/plasmid-like protein (TIGR03299 family)
MAHDLESFGSQTAFALRGTPAWHGLANTLFDADADITTQQMLDSALLSNWNVRLEPVQYPADYRAISETFMVVRTNPADAGNDILATVGERYRVYQNEELFSFADNLTDGGARWESAGSIKRGRQVFGSLEIDREMVIDPQGISDKSKLYLLVTTSHDGSSAIQALVTPVRVVCQNTLNFALNGSKQTFKVRHTQNADGRVQQAREVLGITMAYADKWEAMSQELFETSITKQAFDTLVSNLYPAPDADSKGATTLHTKKVDLIQALYLNSPTQLGITGTAWGALNALTERLDYFRDGRGNGEGILTSASGFEAGINAEKNRILSAVKDLAGIK